ncbi:MAG: hypothetical protein PWR24_2018 [Desulfonauticus sp.]|jgi:quercetin dioxygenase-like cupin family protein|nr:MAG: hypothetical protein XD41_2181 [Desulfonauticus sp. 38_4375]MDK2922461.1 hypothetical protein [Desulfonauticus sp.]
MQGPKPFLEPGKVSALASLVNYNPQAIVSRTLIQNQAGTVTIFAFDKEQALSEHSAPFDALVQVLDGEAEITIAGEKHLVKAGEIILMPANIPHAVKAVSAFKMLLTMLKSK